MKRVLCEDCSAGKQAGEREFYPGEFERVVFGIAGTPTADQRTIYVNGEAQPVMSLEFYNCDDCHGEIRPGDPICCWSVWRPLWRVEEVGWESRYLEVTK